MQGQITALPSSQPGFGHPPVRFSVHIINIQASDSELLPKMNKIRVKDYTNSYGETESPTDIIQIAVLAVVAPLWPL